MLWMIYGFMQKNTQNASIPMSVRRSASHLSLEFTTWETAWMIISWQWDIGCGLGLLPCIYTMVITTRFFHNFFWFLNIWPSVRSQWKCLQILTLHEHEWEWQFGLFGLVRMCNASLVLLQSYSLRHENPFFHPWLYLYCLVEVKLFLLSVQWPLMLENLSHWGIHPDSAFARWYIAIIFPNLRRKNSTPMVSWGTWGSADFTWSPVSHCVLLAGCLQGILLSWV